MVETKSLYKRIDMDRKVPWKEVNTYRILGPPIQIGDASVVCIGKSKEENVAVKMYTIQWIKENEKQYENEVCSFEELKRLDITPKLLRTPLRSANNAYLIIEFCNAGSLDMHLVGVPFPVETIKTIAHFLATALLKMSKINFIHREINPRHILISLDQSDKPFYKLTGLRLCKNLNMEKTNSFVGTATYLAPEVYSRASYGVEADVWSLGLTLFELATGSLLSNSEITERLRKGHPLIFPPAALVANELKDLITKCLVLDPITRITPGKILDHPFVSGNNIPPPIPAPVEIPQVSQYGNDGGPLFKSYRIPNPTDLPKTNQSWRIPPAVPQAYVEPNPNYLIARSYRIAQPKPGINPNYPTNWLPLHPSNGMHERMGVPLPPPAKAEFQPQVPVPKPPELGLPPENKPEQKVIKLDNKQLVELIAKDFSAFIKYINDTTDHKIKFKYERKETLGSYDLVLPKPLGVGGFSEIYLGEDIVTKEKVALKFVRTSKMTTVKVATLLLGEIEIMIELSSCPFGIKIRDYFVYGNNLCLVLDYCNGGDLENYIRKVRSLKAGYPLKELKLVAWNIASGLYEMHKRSMMHRDIKPKNILLIEDEVTKDLVDVKMCDYGLSKKMEECDEGKTGTVLGTYDYFAPELYKIMEKKMQGQNVELKYDYKIDVWSYGVLLYFTLYGKTIMEPPNSKKRVLEDRHIEYPDVAGVPNSYLDLVKKTLTFDPASRPFFAEILRHPFFDVVVLQPRLNMYPYTQGALIEGDCTEKIKVYECKHGAKSFTMKVINTEGVDEKRLTAEVDTLNKLKNSKNVLRLRDYFTVKRTLYLILDFYKRNLEQYVSEREASNAPLKTLEQIFIAYSVLNGINEIHSRNIIHRSIHPKNVLIDLDDKGTLKRVVIGDFGFARVLVEDIAYTQIVTTYNSPEMTIPGRTHNSKTDIWSFGMLLYYIIFGMHPEHYEKNYNISTILKKGEVRYDMDRASKSPELISIMNSTCKVNPKERPTANELLKDSVFAKFTTK